MLGRVGAGKTTLCMALNGLVPHATGGVFRGDVTVLGRNTKQHAVADLARGAGLVFQDPETQLTQMRVEDEVAFGPENLGVPSAEIESRVTWALDAVGLTDYRDRSPLLLSGGEKQRVAIASMLAMRPQVLVLDEPTANLDPAGKAGVFNLLVRGGPRAGRSRFCWASQELERVSRYAGRVVVLHEGRVGLDGPPAEVFSQVARLQDWGIGAPQLAELADLLAQRTGHPRHFLRMGQAYAQLRAEQPAVPVTSGTIAGRQAPISNFQFPASSFQFPASSFQPASNPPQLVLDNVSFSYPDGTPACRRVRQPYRAVGNLWRFWPPTVPARRPWRNTSSACSNRRAGGVLVHGRDTRPAWVAEVARTVGYVFQMPDHQIFATTVGEEIALGCVCRFCPQRRWRSSGRGIVALRPDVTT